jgi:hypothetical protein
MGAEAQNDQAKGSIWFRWDPHIHTPDTVLNDQYAGPDAWNEFLTRLEQTDPAIRALGITDYYSIAQYQRVVEHKKKGRLSNVELLFPNVEIRLEIGTAQGSGVNMHLLFSPEDPNHVQEIERFLERLEFEYQGEHYRCNRGDLIRLGRKHKSSAVTEDAALAVGANQFKVNFAQLKAEREKSDWAKRNCLIAVAAGGRDGSSGLRDEENSFAALRKSIEAFAHIIFSANPSQILFWLGKGAALLSDLEGKWGGMKPCLHGSDAHAFDQVGNPQGDRFCWIKGDLSFESLRQACIEPELRVYIGDSPPRGGLAGKTIAKLSVSSATWLDPTEIPLNPGLVAVIGGRGSGKTALADLIAVGGLSPRSRLSDKSFVQRAREHLHGSFAELTWESGAQTGNSLTDGDEFDDIPRVQYLSQQFVDELCSSEGLSDALMSEIERVIFNAHPIDDREGADSFEELRDLRLAPALERRKNFEVDLDAATNDLATEWQRKQELPGFERQRGDLAKQIEQQLRDRKALITAIGKGQDAKAKRHEQLSSALEQRRRALEAAQARGRSFAALKEYVEDTRKRRAPQLLRELKEQRRDANLEAAEWDAFRLEFLGDVDDILDRRTKEAEALTKGISGSAVAAQEIDARVASGVPFVADNADLSTTAVSLLQAEVTRLAKIIGVDVQNAKRLSQLDDKIAKDNKALEKLDQQIKHASAADSRIKEIRERRRLAYAGVFGAITDFEKQLDGLYAPLKGRLGDATGTLGKLQFTVRRHVNTAAWAEAGELLLDLRKSGPFKGKGALEAAAIEDLYDAWKSGSPDAVANSLLAFIQQHEQHLREHKPDTDDVRAWTLAVSRWLHQTDHITVSYGIQYDGIDIERLSQGSRGIVLLLLYLALDEEDDRPLIIDQPEESLDPQSVFDELVTRFRVAKRRRQIIIVTHNANLVVNTDADQVIIASAGQHGPGELPHMHYHLGGLEDAQIRARVVDILEGGERAFKARAKRLRVRIDPTGTEQVSVPPAPV